MISVTAITLELSQTLPSGEEQRLIVEVNDTDEILQTEAWTNGTIGFSDIIGTATSCLDHGNLRLKAIKEAL
jgi:hypothetical protein